MTIEKVTDPKQQVTDAQVIKLLSDSGIDTNFVEFQDYDSTRPFAKKYVDRKSNLRVQVISNLPMCRKDDGSKTLAGWESSGGTLYNKNNLFEAEITGARLSLSVTNDQPSGISKSDELVWNPQLFIGGEEVKLLSSAILETDPTNENYHDNVIAFDYGHGITRYLRIIEGRMREWWEFTERPPGEVRVKHNQQGGAFLRLGHGTSGMVPLDIAVENGDEEVLRNLDYALPFTIGATSTFYPDSDPELGTVDGIVGRTLSSETWATVRSGAGTYANDSAQNHTFGFYKKANDTTYYTNSFSRFICLFDTSSLSANDNIVGATLTIYYASGRGDHPWGISTSNPASNTALVAADYNVALFGSNILSANFVSGVSAIYTDFEFNTTGLATINTSGVSKYAIRSAFDIKNTPPLWLYTLSPGVSDDIYTRWAACSSSEKGSGYKPKFVVTTETPSGGRAPRGRYHGV